MYLVRNKMQTPGKIVVLSDLPVIVSSSGSNSPSFQESLSFQLEFVVFNVDVGIIKLLLWFGVTFFVVVNGWVCFGNCWVDITGFLSATTVLDGNSFVSSILFSSSSFCVK